MKKIIIIITLLLLTTSLNIAFAASPPTEEQVKSEFLTLVNKHIDGYTDNPRIMVYNISGFESQNVKDGWRKSKCVITGNFEYDIEQTDSTDVPYTAHLIYKMFVLISPPFSTKDEAEKTDTFIQFRQPQVYRITFSYQDGKWLPEKYESQFKVERNLAPFWLPMEKSTLSSPYKRVVVITN